MTEKRTRPKLRQAGVDDDELHEQRGAAENPDIDLGRPATAPCAWKAA